MKLAKEVLVVLSSLDFSGSEARITGGQLDRKLYVKVNEALEACGGTWNRKRKAHVFSGEAQEAIEPVLVSGEITTAREIGFFATPQPLAKQLVAWAGVGPKDDCLEPSAGTGVIAWEMVRAGCRSVTVVERDPKMRLALQDPGDALPKSPHRDFAYFARHLRDRDDFLRIRREEMPVRGMFTKVVMNPPFNRVAGSDQLDHVRHAASMLVEGGTLVSVMCSNVLWRKDRRHQDFRRWVDSHDGYFEEHPPLSFRESGTDISTCVLRMQNWVAGS